MGRGLHFKFNNVLIAALIKIYVEFRWPCRIISGIDRTASNGYVSIYDILL